MHSHTLVKGHNSSSTYIPLPESCRARTALDRLVQFALVAVRPAAASEGELVAGVEELVVILTADLTRSLVRGVYIVVVFRVTFAVRVHIGMVRRFGVWFPLPMTFRAISMTLRVTVTFRGTIAFRHTATSRVSVDGVLWMILRWFCRDVQPISICREPRWC